MTAGLAQYFSGGRQSQCRADGDCRALPLGCSNVLPADVDAGRDFFTESSPAAVRGMLASWPVDECRAWCVRFPLGCRLGGSLLLLPLSAADAASAAATECPSTSGLPAPCSCLQLRTAVVSDAGS